MLPLLFSGAKLQNKCEENSDKRHNFMKKSVFPRNKTFLFALLRQNTSDNLVHEYETTEDYAFYYQPRYQVVG